MLIRLEKEKDWREVENLTREAFWNKYHPGCSEHYVLHQYRHRPDMSTMLKFLAVRKRLSLWLMNCSPAAFRMYAEFIKTRMATRLMMKLLKHLIAIFHPGKRRNCQVSWNKIIFLSL